MKEILEELTRALVHPKNDQVYYEYEERSMNVLWGTEHTLVILEKSKYSRGVVRVVFKKSNIQSEESSTFLKIDYMEVLRKEMLFEVFRYGVFSALDNLERNR